MRTSVLRTSLFILIFGLLLGMPLTLQAQEGQDDKTLNGFIVAFGGRSYNAGSDQTTFTYTVTGTNVPPDLSHFDLEIPTCDPALEAVTYAPADAVSFGVDPTTGVNGIKWDLPLRVDQSRVYAITFAGDVALGTITAAVKGGNGFEAGTVPGAACTQAGIEVVKSVSIDGGASWNDSDLPPGQLVEVGGEVSFLIEVYNTGDFPLTNITLTDTMFDLSGCEIPAILEVDSFFSCITGESTATEGQHVNTVTVTAEYDGETYTDTDSAHYFAGDLPQISLEKLVALGDSGVWYTADSAPGLLVPDDGQVQFRFVVTNDGTEEFSNITLTDSKYPITGCEIPAILGSGESFECIIGPFDVNGDDSDDDDNDDEGGSAFINTATVTAVANGETYTVSDEAHYRTGENDDDDDVVIIIIEGPVEIIIGNIIVIYGINIELNPSDPLLTVIRIGDIIRIEGEVGDDDDNDSTTIIVIAIVVIIIDIDIYIVDDQIWRDDGDCGNPPPPWAPAHGWRAKCQNNIIIIIGGGGKGMGMGMGMGDDDDD